MSFDYLDDAAESLDIAYEKSIIIAIDKNNDVNFVSHHFPEGEKGKQLILKALRLTYENVDKNFDHMETRK